MAKRDVWVRANPTRMGRKLLSANDRWYAIFTVKSVLGRAVTSSTTMKVRPLHSTLRVASIGVEPSAVIQVRRIRCQFRRGLRRFRRSAQLGELFTASRLLLICFAQNRGTVQLALRARQALLRIGIRQAGMNVDERAAVTWAVRIEERSVRLRASVDRSLCANRDTAAKREKRCCTDAGN